MQTQYDDESSIEESIVLLLRRMSWSSFQTRFEGRKSSATQQSHHPGPSDHAFHVGADGLGSHGRRGLQSVLSHHTRILAMEPVPSVHV